MKILIKFLAVTALLLMAVLPIIPASAGPCDHASDTASDGSKCGGRAADQRQGGK